MASDRVRLSISVDVGGWGGVKITVNRDPLGVAWATAPCGCAVRLLAGQAELEAFITHVIDKTPCETERNVDQSIERDR